MVQVCVLLLLLVLVLRLPSITATTTTSTMGLFSNTLAAYLCSRRASSCLLCILLLVYEGDCEHFIKHGQGKYTFASGSVYEGAWREGLQHGKGTFHFFGGDGKRRLRLLTGLLSLFCFAVL